MKKISLYIVICLMALGVTAQNQLGASDDQERIAIAPVLKDWPDNIPEEAGEMLKNKMTQMLTAHGLAAQNEHSLFIMYPTVAINSKEVQSTMPPKTLVNCTITFQIADNASGSVFSSVSHDAKGAGGSDLAAYKNAFSNINVRQGKYQAFIKKGEEKILEYYNSHCDFVLATIDALIQQGDYLTARRYVSHVPKVSKDCYMQAMERLASLGEVTETSSLSEGSEIIFDENIPDPLHGKGTIYITRTLRMDYLGSETYGDKIYMHFGVTNLGEDDLKCYFTNAKVIDENGHEYRAQGLYLGERSVTYANFDVVSGLQTKITAVFPSKLKTVTLFQFDYDRNTFKMKDITL